jgi:hypothetical protein
LARALDDRFARYAGVFGSRREGISGWLSPDTRPRRAPSDGVADYQAKTRRLIPLFELQKA